MATIATGVEVFDRFRKAVGDEEFESSDKLAETLRTLSADQRRLLQLAIEFSYDQGLADA